MSSLRAAYVARINATYAVLGRRAMMVFHVRATDPAYWSQEQFNYLPSLYVNWERGLFGFLLGYNNSRDRSSTLIRTDARALDPRDPQWVATDLAQVQGIPSLPSRKMIPEALAPVVRWRLDPSMGSRVCKTYAVGYVIDPTGQTDPMEINFIDSAALVQQFQNLYQYLFDNGWTMVHPVRSKRLPAGEFTPTVDVLGCDSVDRYMGALWRRGQKRTI